MRILGFSVFLCLAAGSQSVAAAPARSLEDLASGVTISKKARMVLHDIRVGDRSVRPLFDHMTAAGGRHTRYVGSNDKLVLKLRNGAAKNQLRILLLQTGIGDLTILLRDDGWAAKGYAKLPKRLFPKLDVEAVVAMPIAVELTPCEQLTRIVYREIDAILQQQLVRAAQTGDPVTLDDVFTRLLRGTLKAYLDDLPAAEDDQSCVTTYDLLKWIRNEDVRGFAFSKYAVTPAMKGVLEVVAAALVKVRQAQRYDLQIDVTGFTDGTPFKDKPALSVTASSTGLAGLRDPLTMYYAGCVSDYASSKDLYFVPLGKAEGLAVGASITNNCELGAARAYVATTVLSTVLAPAAVYRYATGGVAASGSDASADERRKVAIRMVARTGTTR